MSGTEPTSNSVGNGFIVPDHELLRRIGDGSYGEVWLARSVTGALRAVKIVRQRSFDNSRPYEREFNGLLHFEPLSRGHEGLVDILQVGRSGSDSGFYCVMELADNANPPSAAAASNEPEWMSYQPLTLDVLVRQRGGRLPARDCLNIAIKVAEALRYLHGAGLVHRDIKPSNIIFVGGAPKLADVGLVARTGDARTLVGTEGFLPPEGPGTPRADLYSLGKCLYEMAMGKDRLQFPSPPTRLDALPDCKELLELNEVITCACEQDPAARYQSADALLTDLRRIAAGRSLRSARARKRWLHIGAWAGSVVFAGAAWWLGASLLHRPAPLPPPATSRSAESVPTNALRAVREVHIPDTWPGGVVSVGDYDGGGTPAVLYGYEGKVHVIPTHGPQRDFEVRGFRGVNFALQAVLNLNQTVGDEVVTAWVDGTNVVMSICELRRGGFFDTVHFTAQGSLCQTTNGLKRDLKPDSSLRFLAVLDPPSSTHRRVLTALSSGYSKVPRSLRCYDLVTREVLWDHPLAGWVAEIKIAQAVTNGPRQIVAGTYSTHNGQTEGAENDDHSYVYAVSLDEGKRLWSFETGGPFVRTIPEVAALGGSNSIYVLAWRSTDPLIRAEEPLPPEGRLLRLSLDGRELARREFRVSIYTHSVVDLRHNGQLAVLATDSRGLLHEFNPYDLTEVPAVPVFPPPSQTNCWGELSIVGVADINADGRNEIIMKAAEIHFLSGLGQGRDEGEFNLRRWQNNWVLVYDDQLKEIGRYDATPEETLNASLQVTLLPPRSDGKRQIAVFTDKAVFLELFPRNSAAR
jgi:hypothetical protein